MGRAAGHLRCWAAIAAGALGLSGGGLHGQTPAEQERYQQRLQQLFIRLDRNGDRRLQRQEVQGQPYLERHFERLDRHRRGFLVPADLAPGAGVPGERAERFFRQADRNGDGGIDRREAEAHGWLLRRFGNADRNGDGSVDRQELRGLAEQRRRQLSTPASP
jgi:Ca2+-binding EF-hand superfamily protein